MNLVDLMNLDPPDYLGESTSPFIDEGDGLTSERERVRMLLSLVAHADGYRMMVGAHKYCWMSDAHGRSVVLFRYGRCRYLHIMLMPRGM